MVTIIFIVALFIFGIIAFLTNPPSEDEVNAMSKKTKKGSIK